MLLFCLIFYYLPYYFFYKSFYELYSINVRMIEPVDSKFTKRHGA